MAFQVQPPHFILIPFMAQGHLLPVIDIARLLARRGVTITIFTTPVNAKRFESIVAREVDAGLQIRVIKLGFPSAEAGLPAGCECFDMLPSIESGLNFFAAARLLRPSVEQRLSELKPSPSCILSDMCHPWTSQVARKFQVPRLVFHGFCCFSLLCSHNLTNSEDLDNVTSDAEYFTVPDFPDHIELTKAQVVGPVKPITPEWAEILEQIREAEKEAYGVVVNTFEELELDYVRQYKKAKGKGVWCIGPVSLCNKENLDKAERGNKASINEHQCMKWLDTWEPESVIYACLGSITRLGTSQLIELGLGLESSGRPFVWVTKDASDEFRKWLIEEKFEERTKGRGLLIHGWAPQVLILSHPSIGGFLTHCGWNSTIEGISSGAPMITWPLFAEQFMNEKLVLYVLKTGVKAGVESSVYIGHEEDVGVQVTRDNTKTAIEALMDKGGEGQMRRKRAAELKKMARKAADEGGSSHLNIEQLIKDIMEKVRTKSITDDS
ncbi:UDP-glycosyltransferase 73C4-like [Coffea arabica]